MLFVQDVLGRFGHRVEVFGTRLEKFVGLVWDVFRQWRCLEVQNLIRTYQNMIESNGKLFWEGVVLLKPTKHIEKLCLKGSAPDRASAQSRACRFP